MRRYVKKSSYLSVCKCFLIIGGLLLKETRFCFPFLIFNKKIPFPWYKFLYYICFMLNNSYAIKRIAMFRFLVLSFSVLFLLLNSSCGRNGYTLNGSVAHSFFNGDSVYAVSLSSDSFAVVSKGVIERGAFFLSGNTDSIIIASLYISQRPIVPFVTEAGDIIVSIGEDGAKVKGTPLNDALGNYLAVKDSFDILMTDILRNEARLLMEGVPANEARKLVERDFVLALDYVETYIDSLVRAHYNDAVGPFVLGLYCNGMNYGMLRPKIQTLINDAPESFRNSRFTESLRMLKNDR